MTGNPTALSGKRVLEIGAGEGISWANAQELAAAGPAGLAVMDLRSELESEGRWLHGLHPVGVDRRRRR